MRRSIITAFAIYALVLGTIPFTTSIWQLLCLQVLFGLAHGTLYPILMSLAISGRAEYNRATAIGLFQTIYLVGFTLGPIMAGFIVNTMGLTMVFTSTACACAGVAVLSRWLPKSST